MRNLALLTTFLLVSSAGASAQEDFQYEFLPQFCEDASFRDDRTSWPVEVVQLDESYEEVTTQVSRRQGRWIFELFGSGGCPVEPEGLRIVQLYDNFDRELRDTGQRVVSVTTPGVFTEYFFERRRGQWFLVRYANIGV